MQQLMVQFLPNLGFITLILSAERLFVFSTRREIEGIFAWIYHNSSLFSKKWIHIAQMDINWGGVLFLTQAWVLHKWKSTQLDIFILWYIYLTKVHDQSKLLLSCQIRVKIKKGKSMFYYIWTWVNFYLSNTQAWVRNSTTPLVLQQLYLIYTVMLGGFNLNIVWKSLKIQICYFSKIK